MGRYHMNIRFGKKYITRSGKVATVNSINDSVIPYCISASIDEKPFEVTRDGRFYNSTNIQHPLDLVAEVEEPPDLSDVHGDPLDAKKDCQEIERVYQEFWKSLVEPSGWLDKELIKKELFDFWQVMERVPKVYNHVTGGQVSKILTDPDVVKALADDYYNDPGVETTNEMLEDAKAEIDEWRQRFEWTLATPTDPGWYVYQLVGQWPMHTGQVRLGQWRLAQDPSKMYCNELPADAMNARWFGPLPDPIKPVWVPKKDEPCS
jgi:hypothetical protein